MKHPNTADNPLTILSIAGYCTELTLWNYVHDVANLVKERPMQFCMDDIVIEGSHFISKATTEAKLEDAVWYIGRTLYHLATGLPPFGGTDLRDLADETPVPVIPHGKFSDVLCILAEQSLTLNPSKRPDIEDILEISNNQIQTFMKKRTDRSSLRVRMRQKASLLNDKVHFWKEKMFALILFLLLSAPALSLAQNNPEMEKIVQLTQSMRKQSNRQIVLNELMKDDLWTLMDELKFHSGECSYKDKVSMFGMNDVAREIARKEKGIVNHGNRFKHSADEKHPYSFVELTVQKGKEVTYKVEKHVGKQYITVVPFDAKLTYTVKGYGVQSVVAQRQTDGTMQMSLYPNTKGSYIFSIKNNGKKHASFVVITYNSHK